MAELTEVEGVRAINENENALLCLFPGGERVWIPKSQIGDDSEVKERGDKGTLAIPEWLADKEGLL